MRILDNIFYTLRGSSTRIMYEDAEILFTGHHLAFLVLGKRGGSFTRNHLKIARAFALFRNPPNASEALTGSPDRTGRARFPPGDRKNKQICGVRRGQMSRGIITMRKRTPEGFANNAESSQLPRYARMRRADGLLAVTSVCFTRVRIMRYSARSRHSQSHNRPFPHTLLKKIFHPVTSLRAIISATIPRLCAISR